MNNVSPRAVRVAADAEDEKSGRKSAVQLHGAEGKKAAQEIAEQEVVHSSSKEGQQLQLRSPDNVAIPTNGQLEGSTEDLLRTRQAPEHRKGHIS